MIICINDNFCIIKYKITWGFLSVFKIYTWVSTPLLHGVDAYSLHLQINIYCLHFILLFYFIHFIIHTYILFTAYLLLTSSNKYT